MENEQVEHTKPEVSDSAHVHKKESFLDKTGIYGLELAVAMLTLLIVSTVLSIGAFSLSQFLYGSVGPVLGQTALWSAASTIVWLPVAYIFYLRSQAYMERNPDVVNNGTQRAFVTIYQVVTLLTVISFAFAAVYSLLNAFVQADDMGRTLVTVSLPSFFSALVFAGAFIAFFRKPLVGRKKFATVMLAVSLVVVVPVIIYSMVTLRDANMDEQRSQDLERLEASVNEYARENNGTLPDGLDELNQNVKNDVKGSLSDYDYTKSDSNTFELCAVFATDTTDRYDRYSYAESANDYYSHPRGMQCFTVEVGYGVNPWDAWKFDTNVDEPAL